MTGEGTDQSRRLVPLAIPQSNREIVGTRIAFLALAVCLMDRLDVRVGELIATRSQNSAVRAISHAQDRAAFLFVNRRGELVFRPQVPTDENFVEAEGQQGTVVIEGQADHVRLVSRQGRAKTLEWIGCLDVPEA